MLVVEDERELADAIVLGDAEGVWPRVIADAQRALTARVAEIATETWGADSPTTASLIAARTRLVSATKVDHGNS